MSDSIREGALVGLAATAAAGDVVAQVSTDPGVRLGGMIAGGLARVIAGIVERHGTAGATEAKRILEQLLEAGPQGVTDAQLAADDAALRAEIEAWYAERRD